MNDVDVTAATSSMSAPPSASVQVMRAGNTLSADTLQLLSTEVGLTASRERNRRTGVAVLAPLLGGMAGGLCLLLDRPLAVTVFAAAMASSVVLVVGVAWGVLNRALLDQVARDAAVGPTVLSRAVGLVQRGEGPSSALRRALDTSSSS